jgi:hypothetical protein
VFRQTEHLRAARQFGMSAALSELPCSGIGRKADVDAAVRSMAFLIPTHTFRGQESFQVRGCKEKMRGVCLVLGVPGVIHSPVLHF